MSLTNKNKKREIPHIEIYLQAEGYFAFFCNDFMLKRGGKKSYKQMEGFICATCNNENCTIYKDDMCVSYFLKYDCKLCNNKVDFGYYLIIFFLKKKNLLPKGHCNICCSCMKRLGVKKWEELISQ